MESILGISGFPPISPQCIHFCAETGLGPMPRLSAVAQMGLVGCSVRPQEARDAAVVLGQGSPDLCGCLIGPLS